MEQETKVETIVDTNTDIDSGKQIEVTDKVEEKVEFKSETESDIKPESKKDIMIPKERFDEVNKKYKELTSQMDEMKQAKEQMEKMLAEMKAAQEGTQSTIQETTSKLEAQVKSYEALLTEMVETKLKAVPEDMHELIPDGLSLEQKLAWINKAEAKGLFKKEKVVIGQPLNHSSEQDKTERMKKMNPLQLLASYYGESKK